MSGHAGSQQLASSISYPSAISSRIALKLVIHRPSTVLLSMRCGRQARGSAPLKDWWWAGGLIMPQRTAVWQP
jgi:hypothetical protein